MNITIKTCHEVKDLTPDVQNFIQTWDYWPLAELNNALKTGNYTFYYAQTERELVGALLVMLAGETADLIYLYTVPRYRRQNIGLALLQEWELELKERGRVKTIFLEVRKDNVPAQRLYDVFGMKLIGQRTKYYKDGSDALIYSKEFGD